MPLSVFNSHSIILKIEGKKERKRRYFPRNHSRVDLNLGLVYLYYRPFQQPMAVPTVVWIALGEYIL